MINLYTLINLHYRSLIFDERGARISKNMVLTPALPENWHCFFFQSYNHTELSCSEPLSQRTLKLSPFSPSIDKTRDFFPFFLSFTQSKIKYIYKVNRCLARYSPRATTTNRPTNRALNKPAWPGPN